MEVKNTYFLQDDNGNFEKYHPIVEVDVGNGEIVKMRGRSELLVIKDAKEIYLSKEKHGLCCEGLDNGFTYDITGGGWIPGESHLFSAVREAKEEARLLSRNIVYGGCYNVLYPEPKEWIKKKISKHHWWYGYFTEVFVGSYNGKYNGFIHEEDKDSIIKTGKFYPIDQVIDLLNPIHQQAIRNYLETQ